MGRGGERSSTRYIGWYGAAPPKEELLGIPNWVNERHPAAARQLQDSAGTVLEQWHTAAATEKTSASFLRPTRSQSLLPVLLSVAVSLLQDIHHNY